MESSSNSTTSGEPLITRLPPYFPTTCKKCSEVTKTFFTCFEEHAIMADASDAVTAKQSLTHCQSELRAYMKCMEKEREPKKKGFWIF